MTTEALLHELEHGTEESLVLVLANATEKERKAASAAVIERLERDLAPYLAMGLTAGQARRVMFGWAVGGRKLDLRPHLALIGTGTFAEVKRYGSGIPARASDILVARKPAWLEAWVKWALTTTQIAWPIVRRLVREGLCPRPELDEYYLYMLNSPARDLLANDPALLDHEIWEIFQREGRREANLEQDFMGWSDALVALSNQGRVSRERLLDASLEALELPFKAHRTTWYRNFHEALSPTVEERAARLPLYVSLASSTVPATVKFAMKALGTLEKAGTLPVSELLAAAPAALRGKEKGTALAVLRLLDRGCDASCRDRVVEAASFALEHPASDVQSAALDLIARLAPAGQAAAAVAPRLELAAGSVRQRAGALIGEVQPVEKAHYTPGWTRPDPLGEHETPNTDIEELVLTMTRGIHQGIGPDDLERVLDGVSRLCAERPPRFDDLTSALRSQVTKALASEWTPQIAGVFTGGFTLVQIAAAWLLERMEMRLAPSTTLLQTALGVRPYWIAFRAKRRKPTPLLATPTHANGWIDPRVLVDRIAAGTSTEPDEHIADLAQALYRLAPTHRDEALSMARCLDNAPLRYALGEDLRPGNSTIWTAAAYARSVPVRTYTIEWEPDNWNPGMLRANMIVRPEPPQDPERLGDILAAETQPLKVKMHPYADQSPMLRALGMMPDVIAWATLMTPAEREGFCALGAFRMANNWTNSDPAARVFLSIFEDDCMPMGPAAHMLLGFGLMAREATEADLARNGLARVIGDRRLECDTLGGVLSGLFAHGYVYSNRLAKAFIETARQSLIHADAVRQAIEHALAPALPPRPADQSALLEALLEACTGCGRGPQTIRHYLEALKGGGKGPKLARALLAI